MEPTENSWELSKENVQPLRQGRKIANLTAALQPVNGQDGGLSRVQQEKQYGQNSSSQPSRLNSGCTQGMIRLVSGIGAAAPNSFSTPYPCRITWHLLLYDPRNINIHELALFGMTPFLTWAAKGRHPPRRRLRRRPVTSPLTRWGGRAGQSHRANTFPVLGGIRAQPPAHASAPPTPAAACIAKVLFPRRRHSVSLESGRRVEDAMLFGRGSYPPGPAGECVGKPGTPKIRARHGTAKQPSWSWSPGVLLHWYIKWTEQNFPKGGKDGNLSTLLERCLLFFKDDKRYSNDHRYLQAWIKFAGMTNQPMDIYNFLHDQAIGAQVALFWEAWAWELEQEGDTKKADAVYAEGIQKQAQPVELLIRKQKEFQARVARATLEGGVPQSADMSGAEPQRVTLGGLRGQGKKHQAPVNRTGAVTKVYSTGLGVKPCAPPQVGQAFSIFSEDNPQEQVIPTPTGEWTNPPLPRVTNRENTHKPGKWTEAKVSQKAVPAIPFKAVSMQANSEFSIHVEEGAAQPQPTPQKPIEMGTQPPFEDDPNKIPQYCKKFVYTGLEEFQFEELRAVRHLEMQRKKKMEEEMRRQEEQRRELEEQHQRLLTQQRQQLQELQQNFQQELQQEQQALQQERRQMMEQCRQQMLRERAEMERLLVDRMRDTTLEPATASTAGLTESHREHTVTQHLNFEESLASGLQPSVPETENVDYNTEVEMVEPTPVKTGPQVETGDLQADLRSGQLPHTSAALVPTGIETPREPSFTPNSSNCRGPTPSTTPGRRPITDPSPTINTKAAMMELGEFFRDDIGDMGFGAVGGSDDHGFEDNFAAGPSGGTASSGISFSAPQVQTGGFGGFTIFDESKETVREDRMDLKTQDNSEDQENNVPDGYQTGAKRRGLGVLQPSQGIPVEEPKEIDDLDGIEPFADDSPDMTFASGGNQSSFCTMARMASTPFNRTGPELPELPASSIRPLHDSTRKALGMLEISTTEDLAVAGGSRAGRVSAGSTEETFDATLGNRVAAALSPIMERGESQVSTDHSSTDSAPCLSVAEPIESEAVATSNPPSLAEDGVFVADINPFNLEVVSSLLAKVRGFLTSHQAYQEEDGDMPEIRPGVAINLGTELYHIDKLVGSGAFAKVYQASMLDADDLTDLEGERKVTLKVQQPACPWEFYINTQVHERVSRLQDPMDIRPSLMSIDAMHVFSNGSVLVNEQHSCGTLLDIINLYRAAGKKMKEVMVFFYTLEILYIVEQLHRCHIIHADLKPDNFLIRDGFEDKPQSLFSGQLRGLKLIDFGISLDMDLFPPNTTFCGKSNTSAFQCIEMQTGKPWSYQADLYAVLSTIHCMLFGEYMKAYYEGGKWKITQTPSRSHHPIWKRFFDTFLNIPSCEELPSLTYWISEFQQCWKNKMTLFDKEKWAQYTMYFEKK
ncbi:protein kinase [Branchiostoma belcheri]|nr:protein kinase [Branchiostoma belcheri]